MKDTHNLIWINLHIGRYCISVAIYSYRTFNLKPFMLHKFLVGTKIVHHIWFQVSMYFVFIILSCSFYSYQINRSVFIELVTVRHKTRRYHRKMQSLLTFLGFVESFSIQKNEEGNLTPLQCFSFYIFHVKADSSKVKVFTEKKNMKQERIKNFDNTLWLIRLSFG